MGAWWAGITAICVHASAATTTNTQGHQPSLVTRPIRHVISGPGLARESHTVVENNVAGCRAGVRQDGPCAVRTESHNTCGSVQHMYVCMSVCVCACICVHVCACVRVRVSASVNVWDAREGLYRVGWAGWRRCRAPSCWRGYTQSAGPSAAARAAHGSSARSQWAGGSEARTPTTGAAARPTRPQVSQAAGSGHAHTPCPGRAGSKRLGTRMHRAIGQHGLRTLHMTNMRMYGPAPWC
jgi:hypothetical protein